MFMINRLIGDLQIPSIEIRQMDDKVVKVQSDLV